VDENAKRDAENAKLNERVAKLEQSFPAVDEPQKDKEMLRKASEVSMYLLQVTPRSITQITSRWDKEMEAFLVEKSANLFNIYNT
jgi:hypothetical protein